jgi:hypothetical protein
VHFLFYEKRFVPHAYDIFFNCDHRIRVKNKYSQSIPRIKCFLFEIDSMRLKIEAPSKRSRVRILVEHQDHACPCLISQKHCYFFHWCHCHDDVIPEGKEFVNNGTGLCAVWNLTTQSHCDYELTSTKAICPRHAQGILLNQRKQANYGKAIPARRLQAALTNRGVLTSLSCDGQVARLLKDSHVITRKKDVITKG